MSTESSESRIAMLGSLLKSIESYGAALDVICSIARQPRSDPGSARAICLNDAPDVLALLPAEALHLYIRESCHSRSSEGLGEVFVIDVDAERASLDAFDAVVLAFSAGLRQQPSLANGQLQDWRRFLQEHGQALRGISSAELREYRPRGMTPALLVIRGIESRRSEPLAERVASAVSAGSALGFSNILFIGSNEALPVLRTIWVEVTRKQFNVAVEEVLSKLGPGPYSGESDIRDADDPRHFWTRLRQLAFLLPNREAPPALDRERDRDEDARRDARSLIAAATFPSVKKLTCLVEHLQQHTLIWERNAGGSVKNAGDQSPSTHSDSSEDREAARQALLHALFLTALEIIRPELMHTANSDPGGWQQMFRLQLVFCRLNSTERLLLPMKSAAWETFQNDAELRAFFWRAMGVVDKPLVEPFTSATAMRRHFNLMLSGASARERNYQEAWRKTTVSLRALIERVEKKLEDARNKRNDVHTQAVKVKNAQDCLFAIATTKSSDKAKRKEEVEEEARKRDAAILGKARALIDALQLLDDMQADVQSNPVDDATGELRSIVMAGVKSQRIEPAFKPGERRDSFELVDAAERSLRIVGLIELLGQTRSQLNSELGDSLDETKAVFNEAANDPDDSLAADALVGLARLRLIDDVQDAEDRQAERSEAIADRRGIAKTKMLHLAEAALQRAEMRVMGDELGKLAVSLGKALLYEFQGRAPRAAEVAREVVIAADTAGARELTARAVSIALRCDKASYKKPQWQAFARAQSFIDMQSARSPLVADQVNEPQQKLFVSYRTETRDFSRFLAERAKNWDDKCLKLNVWVDYETIDGDADEFREAMQLGLDRSGVVLIVLSPGYFRSHWCSYELATTLSRRRTAGLRMEWLAMTTEQVIMNEGPTTDPVIYARQLAETAAFTDEDRRYMKSQIEQVVAQPPLVSEIVRMNKDAYEHVLDHLEEALISKRKTESAH